MSEDRVTIRTEHLTIEGRSRAGHETWFRVRELGAALDIGRCPDEIIAVPNVFITHAHLDHAAGIPFYAGQRRLQRLEAGRVWVPEEAAADLRAMMAIHERLEGVEYHIEIVGMRPGDFARIGRTHAVRAHAATHRVPARAWEFLELRHHLKQALAGRSGAELAELRKRGVAIHDEDEHPVLFYTGDTDRGILEQNEAVFRAEVLMIECSFVGEGHQDRAAMYRHIHFDDIVEFAGRFENRVIILTHFSRRYSRQEIRDVVRRRCPASLRDRIHLALPA
ncbi:MAG TPA: MBL fold metallo-hydrolase [Thermoanaerobaculia bacterium]|nr:MBL fold metallo-hydrolase [Thermoanaerobaculia bacterium]